jgi:carboxyl-terminal processing protease
MSSLTTALYTKFFIFDFATRVAAENQTIATPEEFEVTDEIYNKFVAFVKEDHFEYESDSKNEYDALVESAKRDKYYALAQAEFDALKAKLTPNLDNDLGLFKEEISDLLQDEIVSRYYYQKGAIRAAINDDKGIKKAIEELNSETAYSAYFKQGRVVSMN